MSFKRVLHIMNRWFTAAVGVLLLVAGVVFLVRGAILDDTLTVRGVMVLVGLIFSGFGLWYLIKLRR